MAKGYEARYDSVITSLPEQIIIYLVLGKKVMSPLKFSMSTHIT